MERRRSTIGHEKIQPKWTKNRLKLTDRKSLLQHYAGTALEIAKSFVCFALGVWRLAAGLEPELLEQLRAQISIVNKRLGLTVVKSTTKMLKTYSQKGAHAAARLDMAALLITANAAANEAFGILRIANPGLDMLLDLYVKQQAEIPISLTSLGLASRVSQSTGLRWVHLLEQQGVLVRKPDPRDARRWIVELSDEGSEKIEAFLDRLLA